jgi:predicted Zn-dependent peptidase
LVTTAGVPNGKLAEATHIILSEYETIKRIGIDAAELNQAKDCFKGHAVIGLESSSAMASFLGDQAILKDKAEPIESMLKHIDRVTTEQVLSVAKDIFQNKKLNLAVIGPKGEEVAVKAALRFAI